MWRCCSSLRTGPSHAAGTSYPLRNASSRMERFGTSGRSNSGTGSCASRSHHWSRVRGLRVETRTQYWGRKWLALASTMPLAVPSYLLATIIREAMAPRVEALVNGSVQTLFLGSWRLHAVLTLSCTPYVQILVSAALGRLPPAPMKRPDCLCQCVETILGSHRRCLRPTWTFSLVIVAFYVISDFGAVAVLNCEVLTWALYQARHSPADAVRIGFGIILWCLPNSRLFETASWFCTAPTPPGRCANIGPRSTSRSHALGDLRHTCNDCGLGLLLLSSP